MFTKNECSIYDFTYKAQPNISLAYSWPILCVRSLFRKTGVCGAEQINPPSELTLSTNASTGLKALYTKTRYLNLSFWSPSFFSSR